MPDRSSLREDELILAQVSQAHAHEWGNDDGATPVNDSGSLRQLGRFEGQIAQGMAPKQD